MRQLTSNEVKRVSGGRSDQGSVNYVGDDTPEGYWVVFNYATDPGRNEFKGYDDGEEYYGDYGNYNNEYDSFDDYDGVDSPNGPSSVNEPYSGVSQSSEAHWVYSQSSGNLLFVNSSNIVSQVAVGYSGSSLYVNNPDAQAIKNNGPIPKGEYQMGQIDNHKGPITIELRPSSSNDMFGRNNFLVHGDNSYGNHTASEGCIILNREARDLLSNSDVKTIIVTR